MTPEKILWISYLAGAGAILGCKVARYTLGAKRHGSTFKASLADWFFAKEADNYTSWITTIAIVWVLGSLLIEKAISLGAIFGKAVENLEISAPIAFLLGIFAELYAPDVAKTIRKKISKKLDSEG